jgi:hypothetical protein
VNPHYWKISSTQSAGAGTSFVAVASKLTGLKPGTRYTYRLVAQNGVGTTPTHWRSFTTRS